MTRGEVSRLLNSMLQQVDELEEEFKNVKYDRMPRPRERLLIIRDQVMLLALDLKLPLQPHEETKAEG